MGNILKYRHVSEIYEIFEGVFEEVTHTIDGWTVNIGKNSSIGVVDANFEISRVADDEILIHPNPNVDTISGTIIISDNDDPNCYDEQEFSMVQQNGIQAMLKSNPLVVSSNCCPDGIPQSVFKYGAILFTWDEWIKCIKVFCYEPNICVYEDACNNHFLNICVHTCKDIKGVEIYICGYDRCGNLLQQTTIVTDIIHADIESDRIPLICDGEGGVEKWDDEGFCDCDTIPKQEGCIYDCENFPVRKPDPMPEFEPDVPLYPEETECQLIVGNPVINIPYDPDSDEYIGSFKYTGYTDEQTAIFIYDGKIVEGENSASGLTYGVHEVLIDRKNDKGKLNHTFAMGKPSGEILCEAKVTYNFIPYIANEPLLEVYPEDGGDLLPSGQLLFFYDGENIVNNDGCDTFIELDYLDSHKFRVNSGTATWDIFSYDTTKISCKKTKSNGLDYLIIQLIDNSPLACSDKSEIVLKNSDDKYFSFFFAVDEGLVAEDEYVFQWDIDAKTSCGVYYSEDDAICNDYYCNANPKTAFKLISYYSLAIDRGNICHKGGWSYVTKGASYKIERYLGNGKWQNINSYNVETDDENGSCDPENNIFTIYVGDTDSASLEKGDVRITAETSFSNTTLIKAGENGKERDESRCYIDFIQIASGLTIRLYIVHPGVIKYNIYTDQLGKVRAKAE